MRKLALFSAFSLLAAASANAATTIVSFTGTVQSGNGGNIFGSAQNRNLAGLNFTALFVIDDSVPATFRYVGEAESGIGGFPVSGSITIGGSTFLGSHPSGEIRHFNGGGEHEPDTDSMSYLAGWGASQPGLDSYSSMSFELLALGGIFDSADYSIPLDYQVQDGDYAEGHVSILEVATTEEAVPFQRIADALFIVERVKIATEAGEAGETPGNPLLPGVDNPATPGFDIPVTIANPATTFFIDPVYAIGYDYAVDPGGPLFTSVLVPGALPGGDTAFELLLGGATHALTAGVAFDFTPYFAGGVSAFGIRGLDVSEMIDPTDPNGFVTGLTFSQAGSVTVVMTPVTIDTGPVPEPATWTMLMGGFGLVGGAMRRRRRSACEIVA